MKPRGHVGLFDRIVSLISFSPELHKLRRDLDRCIDIHDTTLRGPRSHPLGVIRRYKKRRISMAEAYLMVVKDLESQHSKARLRALDTLLDAAFHAKTTDLPLNTARVQMALMKEAIKNRNNQRKQLELLHDFSESSHGQHQLIRLLCHELNIIELPELGEKLRDMDMGWDSHVHDTSSSGRKNSTQIVIDAFIKGISELTIAYSSASTVDVMEEAVEAGRAMGIKVNIGLEFSLHCVDRRFHFMAMLPNLSTSHELEEYFRKSGSTLGGFYDGLVENQKHRLEAVQRLLENFNQTALEELNDGFPAGPLYQVPKLRMKELAGFIPLGSVNRMHLGEFLFSHYKPILFNRVLFYRAHRERALHDHRNKLISDWDLRIAEQRYAQLLKEYRELSPDLLRKRFFVNPLLGDYVSVIDNLANVKRQLTEAGCKLKLLHPLEHGIDRAKKFLSDNRDDIDFVEIYNIQDSVHRSPDEILELCHFVNDLNRKSESEGKRPLIPVCGSDATGKSPEIPGMGFILDSRVTGRNRSRYLKRHIALPNLVSRMIVAAGKPVPPRAEGNEPSVISMGKISEGYVNRIDEEPEPETITLRRAWRYLNPSLLNALHIAVGFAVAYRFIGTGYACLWLGITGIRNMVTDVISRRGPRLTEWTAKSIHFNNVARSMFWTGFSIPILGFVKTQFDVWWPFTNTGMVFNFSKFFFIALANGLYIASHNTLRGFDKKVIRANFFRSVISWPFASVFAPLGNLLEIPSIVQAKFWSDVVAGVIEGTGKFLKVVRLQRRDLQEILPRVVKGSPDEKHAAILDLLYLYREEPRTRMSLHTILSTGEVTGSDLLATLQNEQVPRDLVDFILAQFASEGAADLVKLAGGTLPDFLDWLTTQYGDSPVVETAVRPAAVAQMSPAALNPVAAESDGVSRSK